MRIFISLFILVAACGPPQNTFDAEADFTFDASPDAGVDVADSGDMTQCVIEGPRSCQPEGWRCAIERHCNTGLSCVKGICTPK